VFKINFITVWHYYIGTSYLLCYCCIDRLNEKGLYAVQYENEEDSGEEVSTSIWLIVFSFVLVCFGDIHGSVYSAATVSCTVYTSIKSKN